MTAPTNAHRPSGRRDQGGLAMLDVLLGMAVFALIAVIAVQGMGKFREQAHLSQVTSDLDQISNAMSVMVANGDSPPPRVAAGSPTRSFPDWDGAGTVARWDNMTGIEGVNLTSGVEVARYGIYGNGIDWHMCLVHRTNGIVDAWAAYYSPRGEIYMSGTGPASVLPLGPSCDGSIL